MDVKPSRHSFGLNKELLGRRRFLRKERARKTPERFSAGSIPWQEKRKGEDREAGNNKGDAGTEPSTVGSSRAQDEGQEGRAVQKVPARFPGVPTLPLTRKLRLQKCGNISPPQFSKNHSLRGGLGKNKGR